MNSVEWDCNHLSGECFGDRHGAHLGGIREDTIFVPNTFGPMQKMAQKLGAPDYEPANYLLDDRYYDNLSGQQAYKCFACRVRKA
jgi:formate dehydrogenase (coenzyme F420) alpha subunit